MSNTLIYIDHAGGKAKKTTFPGITFGQQYAKMTGGELHLVVIGKDVGAVVDEVKGFGATKIHVADNACFANYLAESYATALVAAQKAAGANMIAGSACSTTKDLFARVAARLDAAMASEVLEIVDAKTLKRPMWAGNVIATVELTTEIKLATVRATEFDPPTAGGDAATNALEINVDLAGLQTTFISLKEIKSERPDISTAARVVAGGRGVKGPEGMKLIEDLADALGAGVGASRAACDAGWVPNDAQVGQTGKVVAPDLYVAIGISGAIQHIAGMKSSKTIVAINKDPEAPIFQVADYGLVADLFKAVPELLAAIKS